VLKFDAVKTWKLTLSVDPEAGATLTKTELTVDNGVTVLEALNGVLAGNPYYTFDGWYNGETKIGENDAVASDMSLTARYSVGNVNVTVKYLDATDRTTPVAAPEITEVTSTFGGKLVFTIPDYEGFRLWEIKASVGGTALTLNDSNGYKTWTSSEDITGDVTIELYYYEIFEVTLVGSEGATVVGGEAIVNAKYYVLKGKAGLHAAPLCNDTAITELPAIEYTSVTDSEKYFAVDENKPWVIGENRFSSAEILAATFTSDTTYTADAVKKYLVSFTYEGEGILGLTDEKLEKVEGWYEANDTVTVPKIVAHDCYTAAWETDPVTTVSGAAAYVAKATPKQFNFTTEGKTELVTAGEGIVEGKVTHATDVKFTVDMTNNPTVIVTIGGAAVELTHENGVYTIAGASVTGDINVTVSLGIAVTFTAKAEDASKVNFTATVIDIEKGQKLNADQLQIIAGLTAKDGYILKGWAVEGSTELVVIADVTFEDSITYYAVIETVEYKVTLPENFTVTIGGEAVTGTEATVEFGKDIVLTPVSGRTVVTISATVGGKAVELPRLTAHTR